MSKSRLLVFASGGKNPGQGGSGFRVLVENMHAGILEAEIVGVVSQHADGGVRGIAGEFGIPFYHFSKEFSAETYRTLMSKTEAEWMILSGWIKRVLEPDTPRSLNIHPAKLPSPFGGPGFYGLAVHKRVLEAFRQGEITHSAVSMHFVTEEFDAGPVFFRLPVYICPDDTPESLQKRVNEQEHGWQAYITSLVVNGIIRLEGDKVIVPPWYKEQPYCPEGVQVA